MASEILEALVWAGPASFLLGALPVGLIVARAFGLGDVRKIGSGNIGATNVLRTGNKKAAGLTFALDVAKGAAPALLGGYFFGPWGAGIAGLAAFLGHCYSPFLGFKGGKGVATGLGALLAWRWDIALAALAVFILIVWRTRYVSLGSITAGVVATLGFALFGLAELTLFAAAMAAVSAWRHRENIGRLLRGEENKISLGNRG